jgi:hypothetical protein
MLLFTNSIYHHKLLYDFVAAISYKGYFINYSFFQKFINWSAYFKNNYSFILSFTQIYAYVYINLAYCVKLHNCIIYANAGIIFKIIRRLKTKDSLCQT